MNYLTDHGLLEYAAYRKAGYSKNFLAEHEADILLHKAAKKPLTSWG